MDIFGGIEDLQRMIRYCGQCEGRFGEMRFGFCAQCDLRHSLDFVERDDGRGFEACADAQYQCRADSGGTELRCSYRRIQVLLALSYERNYKSGSSGI